MRGLTGIAFCTLMSAVFLTLVSEADRGEALGAARKMAVAQDDLRQMEAKIGECYAKGGIARLGGIYLGCDLPVPR